MKNYIFLLAFFFTSNSYALCCFDVNFTLIKDKSKIDHLLSACHSEIISLEDDIFAYNSENIFITKFKIEETKGFSILDKRSKKCINISGNRILHLEGINLPNGFYAGFIIEKSNRINLLLTEDGQFIIGIR